jgi:SAM-dependent methyltransferase
MGNHRHRSSIAAVDDVPANMPVHNRRPFYSDFAWAFDLLIDRPVAKECDAIAGWLVERGIYPGADLLDAGCGTGRYAIELARRGYVVGGVDASADLVAVARRAVGAHSVAASFDVGNILALPARQYDAILCRGVLNDFVGDRDRRAVFVEFARALRPGGVLALDVREWEATAVRKRREPLFRKRVSTEHGTLTFTSVTELDAQHRRLLISERHTLDDGRAERSYDHSFVMRCWTQNELDSHLRASGFNSIEWFGAYSPEVAPGSTDRLVAVGRLPGTRS